MVCMNKGNELTSSMIAKEKDWVYVLKEDDE